MRKRSYKPCVPGIKDIVNGVLVHVTCSHGSDETDLIVTLDHTDNGTCSAFEKSGRYVGRYAAVQSSKEAAFEQGRHWRQNFPLARDRHVVHANQNISNHFSSLHEHWIGDETVRLWNIDSVATVFTVPSDIIANLFTHWKSSFAHDARGTLFAFTFQALPRPQLQGCWKHLKAWEHKREIFKKLEESSNEDLAACYLELLNEAMKTHIATLTSGLIVEPVNIEYPAAKHFIPQADVEYCCVENSIVYGPKRVGRKRTCMMFALYRIRKSNGPSTSVSVPPLAVSPNSSHRKRPRCLIDDNDDDEDNELLSVRRKRINAMRKAASDDGYVTRVWSVVRSKVRQLLGMREETCR